MSTLFNAITSSRYRVGVIYFNYFLQNVNCLADPLRKELNLVVAHKEKPHNSCGSEKYISNEEGANGMIEV